VHIAPHSLLVTGMRVRTKLLNLEAVNTNSKHSLSVSKKPTLPKYQCTHNTVNNSEAGITLHSNSQVSLQVIISCLRHIGLILRNLASNAAGHN
jgi:hypothetical protein